ncbi:hypothetical protein [Acaryochloris sp. IP29b_bin.148]|uniref:hypothetical protein n=1 Tax=Acaryochloris sp. IP29b_bin.148 TaxID=2969218 RepID=UPI002609555A|nr:hypothetical protein [Acaryochloris sp. IP29b_bin.148]
MLLHDPDDPVGYLFLHLPQPNFMTRSKLSDSDKQTITQLFRESEETIAQLADRFAVSSSTIRRILKNQLPDQEYDALLATKQEKRTPKSTRKGSASAIQTPDPVPQKTDSVASPRPALIKKRDRTVVNDGTNAKGESQPVPLPKLAEDEDLAEIIADIEHDLHDPPLDEVDEDEDLDDFEADDADESEEDETLEPQSPLGVTLESEALIQVRPFSEVSFPKTCYLVVDRSAELITCPLQAFGELGTIPEDDVNAKTLPIFDNHRIARRFSHRNQRIVKVPNGNVLKKTYSQLVAKGITRLLINGHVYAL